MFFSFVAGLIFGAGTGPAEKIAGASLREKMSLSDSEMGIISFAAMMLLASILVSAIGVNSSAFWLVLGGGIGAFAMRAFAFGKTKMDEKKAAALEAADNVAEKADAVGEDLSDAAGDLKSTAKDAADDAKATVKKAAKKVKADA